MSHAGSLHGQAVLQHLFFTIWDLHLGIFRAFLGQRAQRTVLPFGRLRPAEALAAALRMLWGGFRRRVASSLPMAACWNESRIGGAR